MSTTMRPERYARTTDPISSEVAGAQIARSSLADLIVAAGEDFARQWQRGHRPTEFFCDDDLVAWIESTTNQRQQRNVIARARQLMEDTDLHPNDNPLVVRVGMFPRPETGRIVLYCALATQPHTTSQPELF